MEMWDVGINAPQTKPIAHTIRDNSQTLIALNRLTQTHLNVPEELILRDPSVTMIENDMARRCRNHSSRACCRHPEIGRVFTLEHINTRGKIDRAAYRVIM
jgi:hypothetical protein